MTPKIYVRAGIVRGDVTAPANPAVGIEDYPGELIGCAVAEDGEVLAMHLSSSLDWMRIDLGADGPHRREYEAKYPDGFEIVVV